MYLFDTNIFYSFRPFYPDNFPSFWSKIEQLVKTKNLISVREVYRELMQNCPEKHLEEWAKSHKEIFVIPNESEQKFLLKLMNKEENRNLVKKNNIIKGLPAADPFIITVAKHRAAIVVTHESLHQGARIPYICSKEKISCCSLKDFFKKENIKF